eukprot:6846414-Alexandrium_andersonii.AAC.1
MAAEAVMADLGADPEPPSARADRPGGEGTVDAGHRSTDATGAARAAEATPRSVRGRGGRASPSPSSAGSRSRSPDAGMSLRSGTRLMRAGGRPSSARSHKSPSVE